MNDQAARISAGPMGVCAVLADVLIDKGIVTQRELFDRLRQAQAVASRWSDGFGTGRALADILAYLEPAAEHGRAAVERLDGETVLVVEDHPSLAARLMAILERAGAEVLVARDAAEALSRVAQFDFSAAVLDWHPEKSEQRALTRWLREDGVRILFHAAHPPEDAVSACGDPILVKPAPAAEIVRALARLTGSLGIEDAKGSDPSPPPAEFHS
jgi:CheY-like chemotaxis protein